MASTSSFRQPSRRTARPATQRSGCPGKARKVETAPIAHVTACRACRRARATLVAAHLRRLFRTFDTLPSVERASFLPPPSGESEELSANPHNHHSNSATWPLRLMRKWHGGGCNERQTQVVCVRPRASHWNGRDVGSRTGQRRTDPARQRGIGTVRQRRVGARRRVWPDGARITAPCCAARHPSRTNRRSRRRATVNARPSANAVGIPKHGSSKRGSSVANCGRNALSG
jgi:hypothetical protein